MIQELVPAPLNPLAASRDVWQRYHRLRRQRQKESRPDDPIQPDDQVEAGLKKENPFEFHHHFEVSRDGEMLSSFHGENVAPANPEYPTNKHIFWADAYVRPDERRKRIGAMWLPVIADLMDRYGSTVLEMFTDEESGHGFMKWLGAGAKMTEIESRLNLWEVDWPMLESWAAEGAKRSPHTTLEVHDGRLPEAMWPEFTPQLSAMLNTIPFEGLDHGEIIVTPEKMRHWYERMELSGEVQHTVLTREPGGTISGITDVTWAPYRRSLIHQQFTGVRPEARGRGLGKWIKAAMLLHLRRLHPDARWVSTDNAHSNAAMLKINRALGFKAYRTMIDYQMTREQLETRIGSL